MQGLSPSKRTTLSAPVIDKLISSTLTKAYRHMFYKKNTHNTDFCIVKRKQGDSFVCDFLMGLVKVAYQKNNECRILKFMCMIIALQKGKIELQLFVFR